jgi:glutamyl-tRNA reductase
VAVANRSREPACRLVRHLASHCGVSTGDDESAVQGGYGTETEGCPRSDCPRHFADDPAEPACGVVELQDLGPALPAFDLAICSTGAPHAVLTRTEYEGVLSELTGRLVVIDIAVPRDAEPDLEELGTVELYNVDDLDGLIEQRVGRRREEIPEALRIVDEEVEKFFTWMDGRRVAPTIKLLKERLEETCLDEVERYAGNFHSSDREELEKFARSLCRKILHRPVTGLRRLAEEASNGEHRRAEKVLRRLFGLEEENDG